MKLGHDENVICSVSVFIYKKKIQLGVANDHFIH